MISPEKIRKYPFFSGFSFPQIEKIAKFSQELDIEEGFLFFQDGDQLDHMYVLEEGLVDICLDIPDPDMTEDDVETIAGEYANKMLSVAGLKKGDIFGWTSLIPPYFTSAGALAHTNCKVIAIDARRLENYFQGDWQFGYKMAIKIAQVIRERVRGLRLESINWNSEC